MIGSSNEVVFSRKVACLERGLEKSVFKILSAFARQKVGAHDVSLRIISILKSSVEISPKENSFWTFVQHDLQTIIKIFLCVARMPTVWGIAANKREVHTFRSKFDSHYPAIHLFDLVKVRFKFLMEDNSNSGVFPMILVGLDNAAEEK